MRKMSILMIYEGVDIPRGGVQVHVDTLSKALRNLGHNVLLFSTRPLHSEDVNLRLVMGVLILPFQCFLGIVRTLRLVKKTNIDVVHVHGARLPLLLGSLICRILRVPLIVTIHEAWSRANRLNRQYNEASKIVTISQEVRGILECYGVDKTKLVYIPNMIDAEFCGSDAVDENRGYKLLFIGRLDPSKIGILKILLEATPRIIQKLPTTQVWIVGPHGSKFFEISRMAGEINERIGKEGVLLLGYMENPAKIIEAADIVVGVGRVAMETMAHGKPAIVGSPIEDSMFTGGLVTRENAGELKKYNFTGRNYGKRMNAHEMAELIVSLLRDELGRKTLGDFGRDFVKRNFGTKRVVAEIESVYISCLKQQGC